MTTGISALAAVDKHNEAIRREAFVQGYVAALFPAESSPKQILERLPDAEDAYSKWREGRHG